MNRIYLLLLFCFLFIGSFAQYRQNVRGVVLDKASKVSLPGANIALISETGTNLGTMSDENGAFSLVNVPIGRYRLVVTYMGYEAFELVNLEVNSGKEKLLELELTEEVLEVEEVLVTALKPGETHNKMAALSVRSFSVKETERYAGSMGDPSRMAANFAGVITANDSRNDIIIRGNSPQGLLWKLEGISIPNPNHFGALGSTGGPVSILNNNVLTNSDFFTGAFPAEFGNALSGVFDLKMRNGNNEQHEFTGQIGFNGVELGAEGPLSKERGSSYMFNYRYSVLSVMDKLGFDVADGAVPEYQDLTFKFYLPTENKGTFSVFGIGGNSNIVFEDENTEGGTSYDTSNDVRTINGSSMGVAGLTHRYFPDQQSNIYSTLSVTFQEVSTSIDTVFQSLPSKIFYGENNHEYRIGFTSKYTRKLDAQNTFKAGIEVQNFAINYADSITGEVFDPPIDGYVKQLNTREKSLMLAQLFGEWQYRMNEQTTWYGGLHYQHFFYNNTMAVDPRLSLSYELDRSTKISIAYGHHSQVQPLYVYFTESYNEESGEYSLSNSALKFTKAHHFVAAYDQMVNNYLKVKIETYYQHVYHVPVTANSSYFSMVNAGNTFHQERIENLVNRGYTRNYGTEFTIERFLKDNYYYLLTASLFDSNYKPSDNIWRNTEFNTNYIVNALGGYELRLSAKASIDMNMRLVWSGGKRTLHIDLYQSREENRTVYDHSKAYSAKGAPYFRLDTRFAFKMNGKHITQEWALDLTNMTNHKNVYSVFYNTTKKDIDYVYQQAFFPMFLYRINF
ncbi:TonB-dependent receptor [Roseimarinus sediminis]|jgi:hypothetical protein|uniref:TonB-dependent receptor n=1 Tax=Roseimarinus sediminis TaxID=1610899 RepID=UPI003D215E2E